MPFSCHTLFEFDKKANSYWVWQASSCYSVWFGDYWSLRFFSGHFGGRIFYIYLLEEKNYGTN